MKNAFIVINLICCLQLSGQTMKFETKEKKDFDLAYNLAQRQYNIGVIQSNLANNWGVATTVMSGLSLIGHATTEERSRAHSLSYWGSIVSLGAATIGLIIKISSIEKISTSRSKMNQLDYDKYSGFGSLEFGNSDHGIGFTYIF